MKTCKSCFKEIDDRATKCPHCQAFQSWKFNPQMYGFIFPLLFIPFIFYSTGLFGRPDFEDYKSMISAKLVNDVMADRERVLTYNITNKSNKTWEDITYQLIGKDESGKPVIVESDSKYNWTVLKNSETLISIKLRNTKIVPDKWELKIIKMKTPIL